MRFVCCECKKLVLDDDVIIKSDNCNFYSAMSLYFYCSECFEKMEKEKNQ